MHEQSAKMVTISSSVYYSTMIVLLISNAMTLWLATQFAAVYGQGIGGAMFQIENVHAATLMPGQEVGGSVMQPTPGALTQPQKQYVVEFTGTVNHLSPGVFLMDESIRPGTHVNGRYTFSMPAQDRLPDDPQSGNYLAKGSYQVVAGNYLFQNGGSYTITVYDTNSTDVYGTIAEHITSKNVNPNMNTPINSIVMQLGFPGSYFTNDSLPTTLMVSPEYSNSNELYIYPAVGAYFATKIDTITVKEFTKDNSSIQE